MQINISPYRFVCAQSSIPDGDEAACHSEPNKQKFFGSFFQKRTLFLP
jgi:hypothetical protein